MGDDASTTSSKSDYGYDLARNRSERKQGLPPYDQRPTTGYVYDKADRLDRTTDAAGTQLLDYGFDDAGTTTGRTGTSVCDTFSYDQANRLTQAVVSNCATGTTSTYAYNGDGVRVRKTVGAAATRYVYDVAAGLPVLLEDGARKYVWGAAGAGLGLAYNVSVASAAVEVYHQDHPGSVRELTDSDGHITTIYLTDEYGVPTTLQGTDGTPATGSDQPFWFTGELFDGGPKRPGEPNLVYLRARYYDPGMGRFLARDPWPGWLVGPASQNRHTYSGNNPTNWVDPSGMITGAICVEFDVGRLGLPSTGSACAALTIDLHVGVEAGAHVTAGAGGTTAIATGGVGIGGEFSLTPLSQMNTTGVDVGGSASISGVGGSVDVGIQPSATGPASIDSISASLDLRGGFTPPVPPPTTIEFHGVGTVTCSAGVNISSGFFASCPG